MILTTTPDVPGFQITQILGLVFGDSLVNDTLGRAREQALHEMADQAEVGVTPYSRGDGMLGASVTGTAVKIEILLTQEARSRGRVPSAGGEGADP